METRKCGEKMKTMRDMYELVDDDPNLNDIKYCEDEIIDLKIRDHLIEGFISNINFSNYENVYLIIYNNSKNI